MNQEAGSRKSENLDTFFPKGILCGICQFVLTQAQQKRERPTRTKSIREIKCKFLIVSQWLSSKAQKAHPHKMQHCQILCEWSLVQPLCSALVQLSPTLAQPDTQTYCSLYIHDPEMESRGQVGCNLATNLRVLTHVCCYWLDTTHPLSKH